jgi:hypothetical protein
VSGYASLIESPLRGIMFPLEVAEIRDVTPYSREITHRHLLYIVWSSDEQSSKPCAVLKKVTTMNVIFLQQNILHQTYQQLKLLVLISDRYQYAGSEDLKAVVMKIYLFSCVVR